MDKGSKKALKKDNSIPLNNKKSKIILIFIIVLFISNGFFMYKYTANYLETSSTITKLTQTKQSLSNKVVSLNNTIEKNSRYVANNYCERIESCSGDECLFGCPEAVVGFGYVSGYYFASEEIDWGDVNVICDTLIVEEGSEELVNDLINLVVEDGNGLNSVNQEGKLVLNIGFRSLGELEKSRIINSNVDNLVNLRVVRRTPRGMGASTCQSVVDIVDIY